MTYGTGRKRRLLRLSTSVQEAGRAIQTSIASINEHYEGTSRE